MCILFVYVAERPTPDSYKVILAVNRDEMYKRPTRLAGFWGTKPDILGAQDMEPGREGGTWLAVSKTGKIAALLNVLQSRENSLNGKEKRGRGFLVNNFLLDNSIDGMQYMDEIYRVSEEYNPFSLLTVDVLHKDSPQICYYSCSATKKPQVLAPGKVYGLGNSFIDAPFLKVKSGKEAFSKVVHENNNVMQRSSLIKGILDLLQNQEQFHPDPQMYQQAPDQPEVFLRGVSSRFIKLPGYGTRTHTIILVDFDNKVYYQENTLTEPIVDNDLKWTTSTYEFQMEENQ